MFYELARCKLSELSQLYASPVSALGLLVTHSYIVSVPEEIGYIF